MTISNFVMPIDSCFNIEARRHCEGANESAGDATTTTTATSGSSG